MYILLGCLLGFISGAGVCLMTLKRVAECPKDQKLPVDNVSDDREKLIKQWDNFLNYNSNTCMGGDM